MQSKGYSTRRKESAAVILFLLGSITAWVLYAGELGPPESRDLPLVAALQAQSPAGATSPGERPIRIDRTPLRILEDSYPAFSGVAVDPVRGEIILEPVSKIREMTQLTDSTAISKP